VSKRTTLLVAVLLVCPCAAQTAAAPADAGAVDAQLRARFGFTGPAIRKVGWGVDLLTIAALDRDAPAALVVNDPRRGCLQVLRCKGEELLAETESTGGEIQGLAAADVDGDGAQDLLLLTARGRLVTKVRGAGAAQIPDVEVGLAKTSNALRAGDLDGDGRADAVVLTRDGVRVVTDIATEPVISAAEPVTPNVGSFRLCDADGDGLLDLVLGTSDDDMGLWLKRGRGDGGLGPWLLLPVAKLRAVFPGSGAGGQPCLGTVEGPHGRVVEYAVRRGDAPGGRAVELTSLPQGSRNSARPFAHGDVDGDGDDDLVLADPENARLILLLENDGAFAVRTVPSLSGVDSLALADVDGDGKADLLLASAEERTLAWKSGALAQDAFPARLPSVDQPLAAAVVGDAILFLARTDKREGALWRIRREAGAFGAPEKVLALGRLADSPLRLLALDLDGEHGPELCYVQPGQGLVVLRATEDGGYRRASGEEEGAALMKVEDGALSQLTRDDGTAALLAVRSRFARQLRIGQDGAPVVLAQDNGPEGIEELSLGIVLPNGVRVYADHKAGKVWRSEPGRTPISVDVPKLGATHMVAHGGAVLLLARSGVVRVPFAGPSWYLERLRGHEPPSEKSVYYGGLAADLDGDGQKELAIADAHVHGLHVLVVEGDELRRALTFPVFEVNERGQDQYEPHGVDAGDFDGDGRQDLAVVCHDRVLVYLQEK
jgi:hypothetical protein